MKKPRRKAKVKPEDHEYHFTAANHEEAAAMAETILTKLYGRKPVVVK
jgi:hypothetical protein